MPSKTIKSSKRTKRPLTQEVVWRKRKGLLFQSYLKSEKLIVEILDPKNFNEIISIQGELAALWLKLDGQKTLQHIATSILAEADADKTKRFLDYSYEQLSSFNVVENIAKPQ